MQTSRVLMFAAIAASCVACVTPTDRSSTPVLDTDFPDPFVLPIKVGLVAYATNTDRDIRINVQMSRSRDGRSWSAPVEAMPVVPAWAFAREPSIWAPEVMQIAGHYVLYFSARHAARMRPDGRSLCIGAAVSDVPEGPFVAQPQPLTCGGPHGVIDASPFRDSYDDALWLHFKTDGNCCATPTTVMAQRLSDDGLALVGQATVVQGIANDAPWEGHVVEAPQMLHAKGRYWLFYSGNDYGGKSYATGYAICDAPAGPCRDALENPIMGSDSTLAGPGHPSLFQHGGRTWIAYHGWRDIGHRDTRYRAMYIDRLDWSSDRPVVKRP